MRYLYLAVVAIGLLLLLWFKWDWLLAQNVNIQLIAGLAAIAGLAFSVWPLIHKKETVKEAHASPSEDDLPERYYRALAVDYQRVDMSVIDPAAAMEKNRVQLPEVYCDQRITESRETGDREEMGSRDPSPLLEAAGDSGMKRVVILGPVGSGKSSFVNMLAWQVARSHLCEGYCQLYIKSARLQA